MELERAHEIACDVMGRLSPYCEDGRIEIAGSIRRRRPFVHDIDIVAIPNKDFTFYQLIKEMGKMRLFGDKILRFDLPDGFGVDIYIATPETWGTLLLIRTGSKEHNIKLCSRAKQRLMKLHADGSGLFKMEPGRSLFGQVPDVEGERVAGDTEESIFAALELPYVPPEKRDC